ncbi:hypothetical protein LCL96_21240 [Rossellomorea aquimaris]|uniref:hypothetical protein n=1 Tax=Rossellomorea aquimaris TaxID=189382 RepID=UPI001CD5DE46|nr:hypothetical protein [Rossellomorea aquimaris]MCA1061445.1 hypothetical protein [Rossellomorea aquimaris]
MIDLYNKALAVIFSPIIFSLFMGWMMHTPIEQREYDCCYMDFLDGFLMSIMPSIPLYLVFGLLAAYLIDRISEFYSIKRFRYFFQLFLYILSGLMPALFLGLAAGDIMWTWIFFIYCIPAAVIYYHVFLILHYREKFKNKRYKVFERNDHS